MKPTSQLAWNLFLTLPKTIQHAKQAAHYWPGFNAGRRQWLWLIRHHPSNAAGRGGFSLARPSPGALHASRQPTRSTGPNTPCKPEVGGGHRHPWRCATRSMFAFYSPPRARRGRMGYGRQSNIAGLHSAVAVTSTRSCADSRGAFPRGRRNTEGAGAGGSAVGVGAAAVHTANPGGTTRAGDPRTTPGALASPRQKFNLGRKRTAHLEACRLLSRWRRMVMKLLGSGARKRNQDFSLALSR